MTRKRHTSFPSLSLWLVLYSLHTDFLGAQGKIEKTACTVTLMDTLPSRLKENSGLMVYDGDVYFINDSRNKARIYKWDEANGCISRSFKIAYAMNIDWEDIDADSSMVCIGDVGNNFNIRRRLKMICFPVSFLNDTTKRKLHAEKYRFRYGGNTGMHVNKMSNAYDCEALFLFKDTVYLFTKDRLHYSTTMYKLPINNHKRNNKLYPTQVIPVDGLITGVSICHQTARIALLGYDTEFPFIILTTISNHIDIKSVTKLSLPGLQGYALESIDYLDSETLLISSEEGRNPPTLFKLRIEEIIAVEE